MINQERHTRFDSLFFLYIFKYLALQFVLPPWLVLWRYRQVLQTTSQTNGLAHLQQYSLVALDLEVHSYACLQSHRLRLSCPWFLWRCCRRRRLLSSLRQASLFWAFDGLLAPLHSYRLPMAFLWHSTSRATYLAHQEDREMKRLALLWWRQLNIQLYFFCFLFFIFCAK